MFSGNEILFYNLIFKFPINPKNSREGCIKWFTGKKLKILFWKFT